MEGGGGEFFNVNLGNNDSFSWIEPSPPFTAIDKFLWAQSNFSNRETLLNTGANVSSNFSSRYGVTIYSTDVVFEPISAQETGFIDDFFDHWNQVKDLDSNSNVVESTEESSDHVKSRGKGGSSSNTPKWIKGQWSEEEDSKLIKLVKQYGLRKWALIADKMEGRIGKQCRERWHNHLRPDIKKDIWSDEEEKLFIEAHERVGNKWAEIAKYIPGRTENSIKNHWNATKRKQNSKRKLKRTADQGLNGKTPSVLLEEYIKKKYFNKNGSTTGPNNTNPDEISPSFGTSSASNEDGDSTSYFTFGTCDEEMNFMKSLFGDNESRVSTVENVNDEDSYEAPRSIPTTMTGVEDLVASSSEPNREQMGDVMGIPSQDQVHDHMFLYPEFYFSGIFESQIRTWQ